MDSDDQPISVLIRHSKFEEIHVNDAFKNSENSYIRDDEGRRRKGEWFLILSERKAVQED